MREYIVDLGPAIEWYYADSPKEYADFINSKATTFLGNGLKEEIVRCKDCKEFDYIQDDRGIIHFCKRGGVMRMADPEGFCSWGERRKDA